jgi:hypothetical protein
MVFDRWNWLDREAFREHFGYTNITRYDDQLITKAIRYGCERVDLESGNTISAHLEEKHFPGDPP